MLARRSPEVRQRRRKRTLCRGVIVDITSDDEWVHHQEAEIDKLPEAYNLHETVDENGCWATEALPDDCVLVNGEVVEKATHTPPSPSFPSTVHPSTAPPLIFFFAFLSQFFTAGARF